MELRPLLQQLGLTDKEARLYETSLASGIASITQLAHKAVLKRPTTYLLLEELLKRGMIVEVPRGKRMLYKARNPEDLLVRLEEMREHFKTLMPALSALYNKKSFPTRVRFYEGEKGLRNVYEEVFRAKDIWAVFSPQKFYEVFSEKDNQHFFRILLRNNGTIHDLVERTKAAEKLLASPYRTGLAHSKFLPKETWVSTDILVYGSNIALISFEDASATIIEDKSIATTLKSVLQLLWNTIP